MGELAGIIHGCVGKDHPWVCWQGSSMGALAVLAPSPPSGITNFFTRLVFLEYVAPDGLCTIKLFPCFFTTMCGVGEKVMMSLSDLSCQRTLGRPGPHQSSGHSA